MTICSVVSSSPMVLTYNISRTTSKTTKTCDKCTNFIKTIKATTQFVVFLFVHSWEQRKFEDLYNYASEGGTPDTNNSSFYENGDVPFVKIEDTENKYIDSTKSYITQEGLSHSSAWLIPESSVIFTNGATVGNVAINRLPVATKQGILGIIPSKNVVTEFLFYLLSSSTFQREVRSRMATGTFATIILKNLNQIPVCIPSDKSEQEEIAGYLSAFDNLITLHQCKDFSLKSFFEESKNFISALRKNTSWEQRKLGEVGTTFTGLSGKTKEDFGHGNAGFVTYMNVFSNPIADLTQCEKVEIDSKQAQVKYGDVFFTTSSETPEEVGMSSIWLGKQPNIYLNSFCFGYRPSISTNPYYLGFMLRSASVRKKFILLAQGISRYNISKNKAMEIVIPIPSENEQKKVGSFFKEIDNLITLHQRIKINITGDYHDKKDK